MRNIVPSWQLLVLLVAASCGTISTASSLVTEDGGADRGGAAGELAAPDAAGAGGAAGQVDAGPDLRVDSTQSLDATPSVDALDARPAIAQCTSFNGMAAVLCSVPVPDGGYAYCYVNCGPIPPCAVGSPGPNGLICVASCSDCP